MRKDKELTDIKIKLDNTRTKSYAEAAGASGTASEDRHQTTDKPPILRQHHQMLKPKQTQQVGVWFKGRDNHLSNFFPCQVCVFGRWLLSAEHAYQHQKPSATMIRTVHKTFCRQKRDDMPKGQVLLLEPLLNRARTESG